MHDDEHPKTERGPVAHEIPPVLVTLGDAVELTEGTSNRSGTEDKRYKYR